MFNKMNSANKDSLFSIDWSNLKNIACASVYYSKKIKNSVGLSEFLDCLGCRFFINFIGRRLETELGEFDEIRKVYASKDLVYLEERLRQF